MDISIIVVVFLLFIPVYLMGIVSNNKSLIIFLAIITVLVAMVFAGPKYIFFDVMGVGIALYFAFQHVDE